MKKNILIIKIIVILLTLGYTLSNSFASPPLRNEAYYNRIFCNKINGREEVKLRDNTRVDCLTTDYAIEVDWAEKWYEGVTQALYYAMQTNRKAKLALLVTDKSDKKYYVRSLQFISYYNLPLEVAIIYTNNVN